MDAQKVDFFLATNAKYFPFYTLPQIREQLLKLEDDKLIIIQSMDYRDPTVSLIVSVFLGAFGIDRMLIGDVGLGIAKLLTMGICGVWAVIDWFLIMDATRDRNYKKLQDFLLFCK